MLPVQVLSTSEMAELERLGTGGEVPFGPLGDRHGGAVYGWRSEGRVFTHWAYVTRCEACGGPIHNPMAGCVNPRRVLILQPAVVPD